jgi:hypothetical protein
MSRVLTLALFLGRELFRSVSGIAPLAAALAFGVIAFEYGMDQAQFITVGGIGVGAICTLTTLLLAGRANRASFYPLLPRLRHRWELLAALVLSGMAISWILALLITVANLLAGRLTLDWPSLLWILPTWSVLWLFAAALALPLSALTGRDGSNLLAYVLVVAVLVANDQRNALISRGWSWAAGLVERITWPVGTLLAQGSAGGHGRLYAVALAATLACAVALFALAAILFRDKDLIWTE